MKYPPLGSPAFRLVAFLCLFWLTLGGGPLCFISSPGADASEKSASLQLRAVVPPRMGIHLRGGTGVALHPPQPGRDDFTELARVQVKSNSKESYAVFVSSESKRETLPYEMVQSREGDALSQPLALDGGHEVRAWVSAPAGKRDEGRARSFKVRLKPVGREPAGSRDLRDTVRLSIVAF